MFPLFFPECCSAPSYSDSSDSLCELLEDPPSQSNDDPSVHKCALSQLRDYLSDLAGQPVGTSFLRSHRGLAILPLSAALKIRRDTRHRSDPNVILFFPELASFGAHPDFDSCLRILE